MNTTRLRRPKAAILALLLLLSGCAGAGETAARSTGDTPAGSSAVQPLADEYLCAGYRIPAETLETPLRLDDLGGEVRAAMERSKRREIRSVIADPERWSVIAQREDQLILIAPHSGERDAVSSVLSVYDHMTVSIAKNPIPMFELHEGSEWYLRAASDCAVQPDIELGDLRLARISLDPDEPPAPDATELHLLVLDHSCGGDTDMPERIVEMRVDEDEQAVGLLVGVEPLPQAAAYTCQGFPPTPYTVELDRALGERSIVDLSRWASLGDMRAALATPVEARSAILAENPPKIVTSGNPEPSGMEALLEARLVFDDSGCIYAQTAEGGLMTLVWPDGYSVKGDSFWFEIYDPEGDGAATSDEPIALGGGLVSALGAAWSPAECVIGEQAWAVGGIAR